MINNLIANMHERIHKILVNAEKARISEKGHNFISVPFHSTKFFLSGVLMKLLTFKSSSNRKNSLITLKLNSLSK